MECKNKILFNVGSKYLNRVTLGKTAHRVKRNIVNN